MILDLFDSFIFFKYIVEGCITLVRAQKFLSLHRFRFSISNIWFAMIRFEEINRVTARRGYPHKIKVDNDPEFISMVLDEWVYHNEVKLDFLRPDRPTDNAHIEPFNSNLWDECLNTNWFLSIENARRKLRAWQNDYNEYCPRSSVNNLTLYPNCMYRPRKGSSRVYQYQRARHLGSARVGYGNYRYDYTVFKKATGLTPLQFRIM